MKKTIFFTIADEKNLMWAKGLKRSFENFHKDIEFRIYGPEYVNNALSQDEMFFYKATPWIARNLIEEYDLVVKIDADSVITGELSHIIEDDSYHMGTVLNFNNRDAQKYGLVSVFNIPPQRYMNCGLVAMRNKKFINHWWALCNSPMFASLRFREQDLMNILYYYGDYRAICFDDSGKTINGLANKDYWQGMDMVDGQLALPIYDKPGGSYVQQLDVKVLHWAGGNTLDKMNFDIHFKPEVADFLHKLTQYEQK